MSSDRFKLNPKYLDCFDLLKIDDVHEIYTYNIKQFIHFVNNLNDFVHELIFERQIYKDKLEEMGIDTFDLLNKAHKELLDDE